MRSKSAKAGRARRRYPKGRALWSLDPEVLGFAKRLHGALQRQLRDRNALEDEGRTDFFQAHPAVNRKEREDLDEEKRLRNGFGTVGHEDSRNLDCEVREVVRVGGGMEEPPTLRPRRLFG